VAGEIVGSGGLIATKDGRSEVLFAGFGPLDHAEAGGVEDDAAAANGHAGGNVGVAVHPGPTTVDETKSTVIYLQDSNIGILANGKSAEFRVMDFVGGIDGGTLDEFVERYTHGGEFRKDVVIAEDGEIFDVKVGGNGIGQETLFDSRNGVAEPEAAGAMADVENNATLASFEHDGIQLAVRKNDGKLLREDVGVNVAGPRLFENEIGVGAIGARPKVVHDRTIGCCGTGNGAIDGGPRLVLAIPRLIRPVMGGFHADDEVGIFVDGVSAALDVHFVDTLLKSAAHAVGNDIKESKDADPGVIHDALLFLEKGFGTGSTSVDDGGDARSEDEVGGDSIRLDVGSSFRFEPIERSAAGSDVDVDIDQARGDVESADIDDLFRGGGWNVFLDGSDFAAREGDIHDAVNVIGGVDDVATLEEDLVARSLGFSIREEGEKHESRREGDKRSCEKLHTGSFPFSRHNGMAQGKQADW